MTTDEFDRSVWPHVHTEHLRTGLGDAFREVKIREYQELGQKLGVKMKVVGRDDKITVAFMDKGDFVLYTSIAFGGPSSYTIQRSRATDIEEFRLYGFHVLNALTDMGIEFTMDGHGDRLEVTFPSHLAFQAFQLLVDTGYFYKAATAYMANHGPLLARCDFDDPAADPDIILRGTITSKEWKVAMEMFGQNQKNSSNPPENDLHRD